MKHQEKIRMVIEKIHIDKEFKERVLKIQSKKDFLKLIDEEKIVLEPDEIEKYYNGFLKLQEMEKNGDVPEELEEWLAKWNPEHNTPIKL
jgi:ribosomal protein L19E